MDKVNAVSFLPGFHSKSHLFLRKEFFVVSVENSELSSPPFAFFYFLINKKNGGDNWELFLFFSQVVQELICS